MYVITNYVYCNTFFKYIFCSQKKTSSKRSIDRRAKYLIVYYIRTYLNGFFYEP